MSTMPLSLTGKIVAALVAAGARVDAQDELCLDTPLHKAIRRGMIDNVKHLMVSVNLGEPDIFPIIFCYDQQLLVGQP